MNQFRSRACNKLKFMWLHTMELMTMTSYLTKPHELYQILCLKQERILWVWNTIVLLFGPLKICLNHFKAVSMAQLIQIWICDLFPDRVCITWLCTQNTGYLYYSWSQSVTIRNFYFVNCTFFFSSYTVWS